MEDEKTQRAFTDRSVRCAKVGRTQVTGTTGLYLIVTPAGKRRFIFRYVNPTTKRPNECAIGPYPAIGLKDAREQAQTWQSLVAKKIDPVAQRREQDQKRREETTAFGALVDRYEKDLTARAGTREVVALIRRHAQSLLVLPIAGITTTDIRRALEVVNMSTPKSARRTLTAVATLFDYAKASELRSGDNPASWDVFRFLWAPPPPKVNHSAMPYSDVPAFYARLIAKGSVTALTLAFVILNATRTDETLGARWDEVDMIARSFTIPANRMKMGKEHCIPLSDPALAILEKCANGGMRVTCSRRVTGGNCRCGACKRFCIVKWDAFTRVCMVFAVASAIGQGIARTSRARSRKRRWRTRWQGSRGPIGGAPPSKSVAG
jgi:integrase